MFVKIEKIIADKLADFKDTLRNKIWYSTAEMISTPAPPREPTASKLYPTLMPQLNYNDIALFRCINLVFFNLVVNF